MLMVAMIVDIRVSGIMEKVIDVRLDMSTRHRHYSYRLRVIGDSCSKRINNMQCANHELRFAIQLFLLILSTFPDLWLPMLRPEVQTFAALVGVSATRQ